MAPNSVFARQSATVMGIDKDKMKMNKARDLAESYGFRDSCAFLHELSEETIQIRMQW